MFIYIYSMEKYILFVLFVLNTFLYEVEKECNLYNTLLGGVRILFSRVMSVAFPLGKGFRHDFLHRAGNIPTVSPHITAQTIHYT